MVIGALRRGGAPATGAQSYGCPTTPVRSFSIAIAAGVPSILFTNGEPAPADCPATYAARTLAEAAEIVLAPEP